MYEFNVKKCNTYILNAYEFLILIMSFLRINFNQW